MHLDPALPALVGILLAILLIGLLLKQLRQPHVVGYLIVGIILGPSLLAVIPDETIISRLGAIGVVLLLFFIGMEVTPRQLLSNWKVAVIGTLGQITASVGIVWILGSFLHWPLPRIILIGFVISLSSTAVVLKMLQDWKEMNTEVGQDVLGVLLFQDLAVIPMLLIISMFTGERDLDDHSAYLQLVGAILMFALMLWVLRKEHIRLPLSRWLDEDHEMQVFAALILCLGLALLTGLFELSTALGAFIAGMVVSSAKETRWVHHNLEPFRIIFVALFFVSIGMLVDMSFVSKHWPQIIILVVVVLLTNTFINAVILRMLGDDWKDSLYAGALLSQIGEFSFVLAAVGYQSHIISEQGYQFALAIIACSLLLSPAWIMFTKKMVFGKTRLAQEQKAP